MPKVYLAGPMRGHPQSNFPAFDEAAALGRSLGWTVISPAEMDREAGDDAEINPLPFAGGTPAECRKFAKRDLDVILSLRGEDGDAIALLPGWEVSTAAPAELYTGRWVKLRLLDSRTFEEFVLVPPKACRAAPTSGIIRVAEAVANGEL